MKFNNQAEEDLLVMAAQKGNQDAFRVLFLRYQQPLLRFAYKLSGDIELAKEACQDSWIKASKNLIKLKDPRAFKSWLYRLTRWRTTDLLRQAQAKQSYQQTQQEIAAEDEQGEMLSQQHKESSGVNAEGSVLNMIASLPPVEKQMIHLFYLDEMTIAEISVVLQIPTGTVKSRLNRARTILKQKFGE